MAARKPKIAWGDDAIKAVMTILRNAEKSGKTTKALKVGKRIEKQFVKQGKPKAEVKALQTKMGYMRDELRAPKVAAVRAKNAEIIAKQERTLRATRLGDAATEKGSKLKKGKEIPMSQKKAREAALQGKRAGAQRAKGNAARKAEQERLQKMANDRSLPAKKRVDARRRLRKLQGNEGNFLN